MQRFWGRPIACWKLVLLDWATWRNVGVGAGRSFRHRITLSAVVIAAVLPEGAQREVATHALQ
jgi:hypothetical protein